MQAILSQQTGNLWPSDNNARQMRGILANSVNCNIFRLLLGRQVLAVLNVSVLSYVILCECVKVYRT